MLFLLKDDHGRALLLAQAASKAEADRFGRHHLPQFCGDSIEIDVAARAQAEEFWGVRTVKVVRVVLDPAEPPRKRAGAFLRQGTDTHLWVRGPKLPDEVEEGGLLTPEDHRDLTLDHIARTSEIVGHVQIVKWA